MTAASGSSIPPRPAISLNLFRAPISSSGEILAGAEQLTAGAGLVPGAALSPDGQVAFAPGSLIERIYSIPIATERVASARTRIPLYYGLRNSSPSIWRDGRWLAYAVTDLESRYAMIRLRDLVDGTDRLLVEHLDLPQSDFISISPDGSKVVFSHFSYGGDSGDDRSCFVVAAGGGIPQRISRNCTAPRGFSSDGSIVLVQKLNKTGATGLLRSTWFPNRRRALSATRTTSSITRFSPGTTAGWCSKPLKTGT